MPRPNKLNNVDVEELKESYVRHRMSLREMAHHYECSAMTVRKKLMQNGVSIRDKRGRDRRERTK